MFGPHVVVSAKSCVCEMFMQKFSKQKEFSWFRRDLVSPLARRGLHSLYSFGCPGRELLPSLKSKLVLAAAERREEKYWRYVCPVEWMSYDFVFVIEVSFPSASFSCRSLIHGSVWVKMHNEFIKGDWCNQKRYCLNYWLRARPICSLWDRQPTLSTELTNLIKCTKCYTLTSPLGAIMAREIERSPPGVFYVLAGDCLCQLADCIDYIDL